MPVTLAAPPALADSVRLLDGGAEAFPRMLQAIAQARRYVHLEVYAFSSSGVGAAFVEALEAALDRGVKLRLILDGWGSAADGRALVSRLRARGAEATLYNRLLALFGGHFRRNHRKILLVDDEVAILGGINIGDEYSGSASEPGWADVALEIHGPACARLGKKLRREKQAAGDANAPVHIFLSGGGGRRLEKRYHRAFRASAKQLLVAHAYFLPSPSLLTAMFRAARRGARVQLLLAGRSDVPFARAATRTLYRSLIKAGIEVYEWTESVLHAKIAVVDDQRLLVGSFNLDPFSRSNLETLVEVDDAQAAAAGGAWVREHLARARRVTAADCETTIQRFVIDGMGLFAAWLAQALGRLMRLR
jgi:cardiolipin synthase